ncbi:MAG TPA: UDP-glucose 4-epimerase GalE [Microlunatus sp.]
MTWLVTGGAGYIGSHVVRAFDAEGIAPVVIDDLSSGHREFVRPDVPFYRGSVGNTDLLRHILAAHQIRGVVHLAGFKYAGVSVSRPLHTYTENVTGMIALLDAMAERQVDKIVFSSSAAVFGTPTDELVTEESATRPESPYGESKLIGEWLLRDQARAADLAHTSLRYFNVVGSGYPDLRDTSPHNLFPLVFDQLVAGKTPYINGDDYPTPDGTCVRDYIHVSDLAVSHVAAAQALDAGRALEPVYNLGSGTGLSVREIMDAVARMTKIDFTPEVHPRRPGDPAQIVATGELARRDLAWDMRHTVDQMVASAWVARQEAATT